MTTGPQNIFAAEFPTLLQRHLDHLTQGSGLPLDIIRERGYRSILGKKQLADVGFAPSQQRPTGLLLPVCPPDGSNGFYCYRPDVPRTTKDGKELKYELPKGAMVRLDVPPRCRPLLGDPAVPLWLTEGQKKADALAAQGVGAVALLGVWNFKGRNDFGGVTLLADFDLIAWNSRNVQIVFDSDLLTKRPVQDALARLTEILQRKGAQVTAVYLPPAPGGGKVGVDDFLLAHTCAELEALIDVPRPQPKLAPATIELLDEAPPRLSRPVALIAGWGYVATWLYVKETIIEQLDREGKLVRLDPPQVVTEQRLFIVREDGRVYGDWGDEPLTALGFDIHLPEIPPPDKLWSTPGVKAYNAGFRPEPAEVFQRLAAVVDHFLDFDRSLAPQQTMCELVACYILATWFLDAFTVMGFLWPNGDWGSGKTKLLRVVTALAYLGQVILASGTFASLRDLADYGATLAFDDAENLADPKTSDPEKRTLLLAGNRKGNTIPVKEPRADGTWRTRYVQTFCPRLFSAIRLPDNVLASRAIIVPLVRTADKYKANADPLNPAKWPHDQRLLLNDLWALAVANLATLPAYEAQVDDNAGMLGRNLEPWRAVLAIALWLTEHGVTGLYERLHQLAQDYTQKERPALERSNLTALVIRALCQCTGASIASIPSISSIRMEKGNTPIAKCWTLTTADITAAAITLAQDGDSEGETDHITSKRVGRILARLRLEKDPDTSIRAWKLTADQLARLIIAFGFVAPPSQVNAGNAEDAGNACRPAEQGDYEEGDV